MLFSKLMGKKKNKTKTLEFEVEGIEEAYAPAPEWKAGLRKESKLEVERPEELNPEEEFLPNKPSVWISERRASGLVAGIRRWVKGRKRSGARGK
jgi:hypothetical protein